MGCCFRSLKFKYIIISITIIVASILVWKLMTKIKELKKELKESNSKLRSAYVKFGKSFEHFVPFIKNFPGDKEKTVFLGMPIDFICFDEDYIKFIEVKTGQSALSPKQNKIKKMIENGLVKFEEVRY